MIVECLSISIIIMLTSFVFFRAQKPVYGLLTGILLIVPAVHFLGEIFGRQLAALLGVGFSPLLVALDAAALTISCVLTGLFSGKLETKKQRKGFLVLACSYSIILTWVFIFYVVS